MQVQTNGANRMGINAEQQAVLMRPLNSTRVSKRSIGGKQLSYLESWDVRAHLIRVFGFAGFDAEIVEAVPIYQRDIEVGNDKRPGWEVAYKVVFTLTLRDEHGEWLARYTEAAVGSASGSVGLGDLHDNAVKQGASDALKRCAINLGTQFGLSLYSNGSTNEIVRQTLVGPEAEQKEEQPTDEQIEMLKKSLGGELVSTEPPQAEDVPLPDNETASVS